MAKYSDDLKIKVVKEYQDGNLGTRALAKKHGISKSEVGRWIQIHERFGVDGLRNQQHKQTYSVQFKLDVLSFIEKTGSSEMETAFQFGMKNPGLITSWKRAYREDGFEDLLKGKGRPPMSDTSKNRTNKNKNINDKEKTKEQQLERENELLRLEVEYLKKLRAFQIDPEGYLEEHKQRYHSNSKKNSN